LDHASFANDEKNGEKEKGTEKTTRKIPKAFPLFLGRRRGLFPYTQEPSLSLQMLLNAQKDLPFVSTLC